MFTEALARSLHDYLVEYFYVKHKSVGQYQAITWALEGISSAHPHFVDADFFSEENKAALLDLLEKTPPSKSVVRPHIKSCLHLILSHRFEADKAYRFYLTGSNTNPSMALKM